MNDPKDRLRALYGANVVADVVADDVADVVGDDGARPPPPAHTPFLLFTRKFHGKKSRAPSTILLPWIVCPEHAVIAEESCCQKTSGRRTRKVEEGGVGRGLVGSYKTTSACRLTGRTRFVRIQIAFCTPQPPFIPTHTHYITRGLEGRAKQN